MPDVNQRNRYQEQASRMFLIRIFAQHLDNITHAQTMNDLGIVEPTEEFTQALSKTLFYSQTWPCVLCSRSERQCKVCSSIPAEPLSCPQTSKIASNSTYFKCSPLESFSLNPWLVHYSFCYEPKWNDLSCISNGFFVFQLPF